MSSITKTLTMCVLTLLIAVVTIDTVVIPLFTPQCKQDDKTPTVIDEYRKFAALNSKVFKSRSWKQLSEAMECFW